MSGDSFNSEFKTSKFAAEKIEATAANILDKDGDGYLILDKPRRSLQCENEKPKSLHIRRGFTEATQINF